MDRKTEDNEKLISAILTLKDKNEAKRFLRDLLTESEINEFSRRLMAAELLFENVPYSSITDSTGLSSTTIARISKYLNNGNGGYNLVLSRLHHSRPLRKETGG